MSKLFGQFVMTNGDGSITTRRVEMYETYQDMVADTDNPPPIGIVKQTNTVYHYVDGAWIVGFPNAINDEDYTAFEVFANDQVIPVGYSKELGGEVSEEIPVGMTHKFILRGSTPQDKQDVIVDWGDGEVDRLRDIVPSSELPETKYTSGSYTVLYGLSHTYKTPGKYIVRITGTTYQHITYDEEATDGTSCNLICRAFDADLPIKSDIVNLDSFCTHAKRLLNVNISGKSANVFMHAVNISNVFKHCTNLLSATGFNKYADYRFAGSAFYGCKNLVTTDFIIPATVATIAAIFHGCRKVVIDLSKMLDNASSDLFNNVRVNVTRAFYNCRAMNVEAFVGKADAIGAKLWNNTSNEFVYEFEGQEVFKYCPDEIRAYIPVAWGGTKTE